MESVDEAPFEVVARSMPPGGFDVRVLGRDSAGTGSGSRRPGCRGSSKNGSYGNPAVRLHPTVPLCTGPSVSSSATAA